MTGSGGSDDPFYWSTERLVQELCSPDRSWDAPPPKKWPDPEHLAGMLREHELEGQDLITYEDLMGREAFDTLCRDLEIKKIPHKASLRLAIRLFQNRSSAYLTWKETQAHRDATLSKNGVTESSGRPEQKKVSDAPSSTKANGGEHEKTSDRISASRDKEKPAGSAPIGINTANGYLNGDAYPSPTAVDALVSPPGQLPDPSKKRKRVAPTNVSSTPLTRPDNSFNNIPDMSAASSVDSSDQLWQQSAADAYLGHWKLSRDALLQGPDPLDPSNSNDLQLGTFGWTFSRPIPPGRRLQVHQIFQQFLQPRRPALNLGRSRVFQTSNAPGASEEEDAVLPALGESDDEGYDTETWEAMALEEQERDNLKKRKNAPLPLETVDAIIADAIRGIEDKWATKKLPKLRRREHALWMAARRYGTRKYKMDVARKEVDRFGRRIAKLVEEMRNVEWKNEAEVRRQAAVLDANVEDKQHALWEARLYSSPTAPQKVTVRRLAQPRSRALSRTVRPRVADDDSEILTSSSDEDEGADDDGLGSFIVDDENLSDVADELATTDNSHHHPDSDPMMVDTDDGARPNVVGSANGQDVADLGITSPKPAHAVSIGSLATDPIGDIAAIVERGALYWEAARDVMRLLCTVFFELNQEQLSRLFQALTLDDEAIWQKFCAPTLGREHELNTEPHDLLSPGMLEDDATAFTRLFDIFLTCRNVAPHDFSPRANETHTRLVMNRSLLGNFCVKMRIMEPYFRRREEMSPSTLAAKVAVESSNKPGGVEVVDIDSDDDEEPEVRAVAKQEETDDDDSEVQSSPSYRRRRRHIPRDQRAQDLRDKDKARFEEQETRRKALYESLAQSANYSHDLSRLIINTAKDKDHGLVYVNSRIGRFIRDHQIEGVRFMWNQIIAPSEVRQGCLLAHTMGLGKTMQVITLLVAISEAAASGDKDISSQIPADLRQSRTLILCPSGLVENWMDELLAWAPPDCLGERYHVAAAMGLGERFEEVSRWANCGGTLVLGYPMFRRLLSDFGDEMQLLLEESPNVVIADEAHALKNPKSKVHQVTANFKTTARIAMTGSPLANSVDEYHSMINWVAPNYLADHLEFVSVYANPIKQGFYRDSSAYDKRRALKLLKVLKETVAPKVHRATVATLKGELPPKKEFILYLPLTELQLKIYSTFLNIMKGPSIMNDIRNTVQLWNVLLNLTLLLAHPKVFQMRLDEMRKQLLTMQGGRHLVPSGPRTGVFSLQTVHELLAAVNHRDVDNLAYSSKIVVLMGILDEAKRIGDKVLIFSQSKLVLDYLEVEFQRQKRRFSRLDGDTAVGKRQAMVKDFNTGQDEIYLISTTAGGVGLNIQGANRVVIFDFRWNPMQEQQAIGRAYRIGQTKPVFVYWLIIGGTFETVLHDQAVFKTQLASRVVDKKNPSAWADQMRNYTADPSIMTFDHSVEGKFRDRDVVLDALLANGSLTKGRICKIVSADTFEEEEPEAKLTAEELNEAADMVNKNKMRLRNARDETDGLRPTYPLERVPVDGANFAPAAPNAPIVPINLPTGTQALISSTQAQQPMATGGPAPIVQPLQAPQPPLLPMQIPTHDTTRSVHLGRPTTTSASTIQLNPAEGDLSREPTPELQETAPAQAAPATNPSLLVGTPEELAKALRDKLLDGSISSQRKLTPQDADRIAKKTALEVERSFEIGGVPARAQWGRLRTRAAGDAQFVEAVIYGAIGPKTLAMMTAAEEDAIVAHTHEAMAEIQDPALFNRRSMSKSAELFSMPNALERILERTLFLGSTSLPALTGSDLAKDVAHKTVADIQEATQQSERDTTALLERLARRAFRDEQFADALISRSFDFRSLVNMTPDEEDRLVREVHAKHANEVSGIANGALKNGASGALKTETDEIFDSALKNIPASRPGGHARRPSSGLPHGPLENAQTSDRGEANPEPRPATQMRFKDPDHVREHLWRSQNRKREPRAGGGQGARDLDLMAMREVMDRRERKSIAPPSTRPERRKSFVPPPFPPPPQPARPTGPPPQLDGTSVSFTAREAPRITPSSQLERSMLEADRLSGRPALQNAKKHNRPKILPPPAARPGQQAGDNAHNPFVLD